MIHIDLTDEEAQHLKQEVETRLTELDREIAHTDSLDFKDLLKRRRESIRRFLQKLPAATLVAA